MRIAKGQRLLIGLGKVNPKDYDSLAVLDYEADEKEQTAIGYTLTTDGLKGNGVTKYKGTVYALLDRGY